VQRAAEATRIERHERKQTTTHGQSTLRRRTLVPYPRSTRRKHRREREAVGRLSAPVRRGPGKDPRIVTFRGTLEALLESLDATVRIARWQGHDEPIPEPLQRSAARWQDNLGSATRLAAGKFVGAPAVVNTSDAIKQAVQELDAALVAYRKRLDGTALEHSEAAMALDAVLGRVKLDAGRWE
jgi:hypothetical protein